MALSKEKIAELLAKKSKPRQTGGTGSRAKKTNPDDRSYQAWFSMNHMLIDHETMEMVFCDNPNCTDPRDKTYGQTVVEIGGQKLCRFCFIEGWLTTNPSQTTLSTPSVTGE